MQVVTFKKSIFYFWRFLKELYQECSLQISR